MSDPAPAFERARSTTPVIVPLTPQQESLWSETRAALLWGSPMFSHILYSMMNPGQSQMIALFTKDVPIAATDGVNLIINPDTFFKMTLGERVFVVAHEIMHCVWAHCETMLGYAKRKKIDYPDGKSVPFHHKLWNVATDLVINDLLIESQIGAAPKDCLHDRSTATSTDSAVDVYRKLYKQCPPQPSEGGEYVLGGNLQGKSGFDELKDPGTGQGKDATQAAQARNDTEWKTQVAAAMASAKAQGKLPAGVERVFGEILEPQVPWQEHIRSFFARKVGSGSFDWLKPDRRLIVRDIYAPARSGNGCGAIAVAIDTSGSIGQRELDVFFGEMRGIMEDVRPERLYVIWCDAKVHKVDEIEDAAELGGLKPHGGGGTDFRPPFDWIADNHVRIDALVYLTDGLGTFPAKPPSYPVLWGDILKMAKFPWGDVVVVPLKD